MIVQRVGNNDSTQATNLYPTGMDQVAQDRGDCQLTLQRGVADLGSARFGEFALDPRPSGTNAGSAFAMLSKGHDYVGLRFPVRHEADEARGHAGNVGSFGGPRSLTALVPRLIFRSWRSLTKFNSTAWTAVLTAALHRRNCRKSGFPSTQCRGEMGIR
jgi:hypothetical protein